MDAEAHKDMNISNYEHLTAETIKECRKNLKDVIIAPFNESHAKGIGYNFSLSEMIYSINRKSLVPICRESHQTYFFLKPHETVLALSYEYIKVSDMIAGSFHSRVRTTAQGVGSTSTTLDPGWAGMLLFTLNNPTRKKIKIILSTRVNGINVPNPIVTLVVWRTPSIQNDSTNKQLTLNLDNPPMRVDIWSEFTVPRVRIINNRKHQQFCQLIESLSPFYPAPSQNLEWVARLGDLLTVLRKNITAYKSKKDVIASLIEIQQLKDVPPALNNHLLKLTNVLKEDDILSACSKKEYLEIMDLADREIQYQLLCDQTLQIHTMISEKVPLSWHKNFWASLFQGFWHNLGIIVATAMMILFVFYGQIIEDTNYLTKLVIAFVPIVCSIVVHRIIGISK